MTKEEITNSDIDIFAIMDKLPKENINAVYIRWDKETGDVFTNLKCFETDVCGLFGAAINRENPTENDLKMRIEPCEDAYLNLAMHILIDGTEHMANEFIEFLKMKRAEKQLKID